MNLNTNELPDQDELLAKEYTYWVALKVRDYECDMQGIVNNTVYMHYLEHARHEYLNDIGLNWKTLIDKGIYLVAVSAEVVYKKPMVSGQNFTVTCRMQPESKFKIKFIHEILNDKQECVLTGSMIAAFIDKEKKPILVEKAIGAMSLLE